jgi:hypothetical protein
LQQINNGDFEKLELVIIKNGDQVNADGVVNVSLYNADDSTNTVLSSGSSTNEPPFGIYSYQVTPIITSLNKVI